MIEIKSTNPQLSFILEKNPNTQRESNQAFERELRKGRLYGWFSTESANTFRMMFVDAKTESSFNRSQQFEYLDRTRYSSSYLPVAAIGTMLAKAMKTRHEFDIDGYTNSFSCIIELANVGLANRMLRIMPEIQIEPVQTSNGPCRHLFHMNVVTTKTIYHMLNLVQVFCIMQAVADWNLWIPMDESSARKYVRSLNVIDAPYYLRYTLQAFGIQSPEVFKAVRTDLAGATYILNYGKTDEHRLNGILPKLPGGDVLWDIGCGELKYTRKLCKSYAQIVAFDADPEIQEKNVFRLKNRGIANVELRGRLGCHPFDFEDFKPGTDILMTEVLEHMPKDVAQAMLAQIAKLPFRYAIFTVPNKDFNKFYGFDENDKRHVDHHYEPTSFEFADMLIDANFHEHLVEFIQISDTVLDGVSGTPATIGVRVTNAAFIKKTVSVDEEVAA